MNQDNNLKNWIVRFVKGMFIGAGTILPGVSGGALSAIFGLYEPIISFLSNIRENFWVNFYFFIPFGLGAFFGIFALTAPLNYGLNHYPVHILWGFIGAITGTLPSLYKEAGRKGRHKKHLLITFITAVFSFLVLIYFKHNLNINLPQNIFTWLFAGSIFGSGLIIPGLSTSNFLIYFNLYQDLLDSIQNINLFVLVPLVISGILTIILFSKLMKKIIIQRYTIIFHLILGIVISSTAMIAPEKKQYATFQFIDYASIFIIFLLGSAIAYFLTRLEDKMK